MNRPLICDFIKSNPLTPKLKYEYNPFLGLNVIHTPDGSTQCLITADVNSAVETITKIKAEESDEVLQNEILFEIVTEIKGEEAKETITRNILSETITKTQSEENQDFALKTIMSETITLVEGEESSE